MLPPLAALPIGRVSDVGLFGVFLICVLAGIGAGLLVDGYGQQHGWREADRTVAGIGAFVIVVIVLGVVLVSI